MLQTTPPLAISRCHFYSLEPDSDSEIASPMLKSTQSRLSTNHSPTISPRKCVMEQVSFEEEEEQEEYCPNFTDRGYCLNGISCPFFHSIASDNKASCKSRILTNYPEMLYRYKDTFTRSFAG